MSFSLWQTEAVVISNHFEKDKTMAGNSKPVYDVFVVEDREEGDAFWIKVGAAFGHKDRDGMNIVLQALPPNGRLVLRRFKEKEDDKRL